MEMFEVGGCVRDEILGVPSKDIDFTVVLSPDDLPAFGTTVNEPDPFNIMKMMLEAMDFEIFLETPEFFTIRARFPRELTEANLNVPASVFQMRNGLTADFVLARKEFDYTDGRRPDRVEIGTLKDDLARRDFTMNAIAKAADGSLIDPFNGVKDINDRVIRAVGSAFDRLNEDALRALRALRFSVTKGFRIETELAFAMESAAVLNLIETKISDERIREELDKMFKFDTLKSLDAMNRFPALTRAVLSGKVGLVPTMKQKGRGRA